MQSQLHVDDVIPHAGLFLTGSFVRAILVRYLSDSSYWLLSGPSPTSHALAVFRSSWSFLPSLGQIRIRLFGHHVLLLSAITYASETPGWEALGMGGNIQDVTRITQMPESNFTGFITCNYRSANLMKIILSRCLICTQLASLVLVADACLMRAVGTSSGSPDAKRNAQETQPEFQVGRPPNVCESRMSPELPSVVTAVCREYSARSVDVIDVGRDTCASHSRGRRSGPAWLFETDGARSVGGRNHVFQISVQA